MADTSLDISQHLDNIEELLAGIIEAQEILACFISVIGRQVQMDDIFQEMYVVLDHLMNSLNEYRIHFQDTLEWHQLRYASSTTSKVEVEKVGRVGRPRITINEEQLASLRSLGMKWNKIATLLGVYQFTLLRKRKSFSNDFSFKTNYITHWGTPFSLFMWL